MTVRVRFVLSLLVLPSWCAGLVGQLGVHAHAFGEIDRAAHSLIEIDHPPAPAGTHHVERAIELRHPVCGDCLLVSFKSDGALAPVTIAALDRSGIQRGAPGSPEPRRSPGRRAPARAPPLA